MSLVNITTKSKTIQKLLTCVMLIATTLVSAATMFDDSVVQVLNTSNVYSYTSPWMPLTQDSSSRATGIVLEGNKIITNAHAVDGIGFIQVELASDNTKYVATVDLIDYSCDLAILKIEDENFWKNAKPLSITTRSPKLREKILVMGFPMGGTELTVTEGIVSRLEVQGYIASGYGHELLVAQIDANTWPGSSGGPAISIETGEVIGITHQGSMEHNTNYVIPSPVINHFLEDYASGDYKGFVVMPISDQPMENKSMRESYGMSPEQSGIKVKKVKGDSYEGDENFLQPEDVILSINDNKVANDGNVRLDTGNKVNYRHIVSSLQYGDNIKLDILRNGKPKTLNILANTKYEDFNLITFRPQEEKPEYFVYGGIVFQPASINLLKSHYGRDWMYVTPTKILTELQYGIRDYKGEQVVLLTRILANKHTMGYPGNVDIIVKKVNDVEINGLTDVIKAIDEHKGKFHTIELIEGVSVVIENLDKTSLEAALASYGIANDRYINPDMH